MCSSMWASPRWSSSSSIDPAWTASRSIARFCGSTFRRMKYVSPFGSLPVRIAGSSGSGAVASAVVVRGTAGACAAAGVTVATLTRSSSANRRYAARMRLKIRRLDSTVALPVYGTGESAGFDLAAAHDVTVGPGQIVLVRTGLVIEVPSGHFLAIFARSSTPLKRGLMVANGVGVIDPDYSGPDDEVMIQVLNVTNAPGEVRRGDRLAQGIILQSPRVTWQEVTEVRAVTRGGFGATGN